MTTGLLATKLYSPPLRASFVPRPRLVEKVRAGLAGKLTLLVAPAGFGKTTLLSEAIGERQAAWVALDAGDSDARRFWSYVLAALDTLAPGIGDTTRALLESPQPPAPEALLTMLLNALNELPAGATLVLDDYHVLDGPAVHDGVSFMLEHLSPRLHLVIATRADPPLRLARLRARAELTELRAADLRFTAAEAATFLSDVMELPVSAAESAALERRTEGWIAGLQLAALALRGRADTAGFIEQFTGSNRFVVDYLAEEVFERQPAHIQTFLLQTSILERLCGPLCDAVLGIGGQGSGVRGQAGHISQFSFDSPRQSVTPSFLTPDPRSLPPDSYSQALLEELEHGSLFIEPLDDERRWYRYHQLFAEVLRNRLQGASGELIATLHARAGAWCEQQGLFDEAVRYALRGSDFDRAAELIERYAMALMLGSGNVFGVRAWIEQLPRELIVARPRLALAVGIALILTGKRAAVEQLLADAAPVLGADLAGEVAVLRSTIARFDRDAATVLALTAQAREQLAPDNHPFRAVSAINSGVALLMLGDAQAATTAFSEAVEHAAQCGGWWAALGALEELGSQHLRQGRLREALATFERAVQLSDNLNGRRMPAAGIGHVGIAEVLYEWNDLAQAAQAATRGIELLRASVERGLLARGYLVLAQIYQANGADNAALESIRLCEEWFAQTQLAVPHQLARLAAYRARLWLRQGRLAEAGSWARERGTPDEPELELIEQLTLVRVWLAEGDHGAPTLDQVDATLARLLAVARERTWTRYVIEIGMLRALLCRRQGSLDAAAHELGRTLALAHAEGYVRLFVDEGPPIGELLARLLAGAQDGQLPAVRVYARDLLAAIGTTAAQPREASNVTTAVAALSQALPEQLTERELEVLRLVAGGLSNQDIAARLVVAVSTVKKHLNNIYGKLETQSRTQAIARARELGLL